VSGLGQERLSVGQDGARSAHLHGLRFRSPGQGRRQAGRRVGRPAGKSTGWTM